MLKKLIYIGILTLLAVNLAAQNPYVVDSVCAGANRDYRIDGETKRDSFAWFILDTFGVTLANPPYTDFEDINAPSDTTWGSEINYIWNTVGEFDILTLHFSEHGCDTFEMGRVKVYEAPFVDAGNDRVVCTNSPVILSGSSATNYSTLTWTTGGDGTFDFDDQLHPTYTPGPNDSIAGSVLLTITANGLAVNGTCSPAIDAINIQFSNPQITFTQGDLTCYGDSSGHAKVIATGGVEPYTYSWSGPNGYNASTDSIFGLAAGTYIATVTDAISCSVTDSVIITEPPELVASISASVASVCQGGTMQLNGNPTGGTGTYTHVWSGDGATYLSQTDVVDPVFSATTDGVYTFIYSVTDANGCFDADTISVVVTPITRDTIDYTACENELPYIWNTNTYTVPGIYSDTFTSATGCDSILVLNFDILPTYRDTVDVTVCETVLPYSWESLTLTSAGIFSDTLQTVAGCDSILTVNFDILPTFRDTVDIDICASALPFNWESLSINAAGTYSDTLQTVAGCDSILTVNLNVNPINTETLQMTVCENELPFDWMGETFNAADTIIQNIASTTAGCDTVRTLQLQVTPTFRDTVDIDICASALPFNWESLSINTAGTYSDTLQTVAGCDSILTVNLNVNPINTETLQMTVCENELPFDWMGETFNFADTIIQNIASTTAGCDTVRTLQLQVTPTFRDTVDIDICASALPFNWESLSINAAGTYSDTLQTVAGCDSILTVNLNVNPINTETLQMTVCENELPFDWMGETFNAADTIIQNIASTTAGCDTVRTLQLQVTPTFRDTVDIDICASALPFNWESLSINAAGVYSDTLQTVAGCDSILTVNLNVNPVNTETLQMTVCENELPFDWMGETFNTADTIIQNIASTTAGCDTARTLQLQVTPTFRDTVDIDICASALPFNWESLSINAAGTYSDTLQTVAGCDSILTVNLNVNPVNTETLQMTVCENELPFDWRGETFNAADTIIQNIASTTAGCDTVRTLQLQVTPTFRDTVDIDICASALPFNWESLSINAAGVYSDTLQTVAGCDSILTVNLNVNPINTETLQMTVCENELPFDWMGETFNTADTIIQNIASTTAGCDTVRTLQLQVTPTFRDTVDIDICASALPFNWESLSINAAGTYSDTLQTVAGCDSILTVNLNVAPVITGTETLDICDSQIPFDWHGQSIVAAGTYSDTLVSAAGCDSIIVLTLNVIPTLTSTENVEICDTDLPYLWNGQTLTADGNYTASLTSANGCDSIVTLTLTIHSGSFADSTVTACESFTWTAGDGNTYTTSGVYNYYTTNANGCEDTLQLHLIISPDITVNAAPEPVICYGESNGSIDITVSGGIAPFTYLWSNGETTEDITGLAMGTYSVVVTDSIGCSDSVSVDITQPDELAVSETHTNIGLGETNTGTIDIIVTGGTQPYSYVWNNGATTEDLSNLAAGDYTLTVTDANSCSAIISITITEESATYSMDCPDDIMVGCYTDLLAHLPFADYLEYTAAGGLAQSDCGIDESTFHLVSAQLIDSIYCVNLLFTYSITDSCGNTMECSQFMAVNDTLAPVVNCPDPITVVNKPAPPPYSGYSEFVAAKGDATDNCEIIESTFKWSGDESDGKIDPELITRTYEIADSCGNIGTCSQLITVYAKSEVVITIPNLSLSCPDDLPPAYTTLDEFIASGGMAHSDEPYSLDTASFKVEPDVSDGNSCPETITRTYSIRNSNGDLATYDQIIVINDVTPPTFRFIERNVECGNEPPVYNTIADLQNSSRVRDLYDNCELVKVVLQNEQRTGSCPEILVRTYELFDACGNSKIATEKTNIYDTRPPFKIKDLKNITADCNVPKPYTSYKEFKTKGHGQYMDCSKFKISWIKDSVSVTEANTIYRIYHVVDVCDNYAVAIQKITTNFVVPVFDPIDPICQNTAPPALPTTDKNGITGVWDPATIETSAAGTFTYTFIPDNGQCAIQKSMVIEITPEIILTETHRNIGFSDQPIGSIDLTVSGGTGTTFNYAWSNGATTEDIDHLPEGIYSVSVTDIMGCTAQLTVTITAKEAKTTVKPIVDTIECITEIPEIYSSLAQFIADGGVATSDCGIDLSKFKMVKDSSDNNSCPETIYRIYSISDNCGHSLRLLHIIVINDITPPTIICPPDSSVECLSALANNYKTIAGFVAAGGTISDNCAIDSSSFTAVSTTIKTVNSTTVTTVYSIQDLCGNSNSCTHLFTLTDTVPPTANCNPVTVYLDSLGNYTLTDNDKILIAQGSTDNCTSFENLLIDIDVSTFDCEDVESGTTVHITVTDEAGNSDDCSTTITVVDSLPPVALCQATTIYLDANGTATIDVSQIDNGSYDNCKLDTMYLSQYEFDCSNVGFNPVDLIVIDAAGNRATCTTNVAVLDTISPQVIARDLSVQLDKDGNYTLTADELLIGAVDNCEVDTVYLDQYNLDCSDIGTTYVTVTAVDVNGNMGTDIAELTIYGNVAPIVQNDSAITAMNMAVTIDIISNDFDTKTNIDISTLAIISQPANGKITTNTVTGEITYTPDSNFVGTEIVSYSICDDAIPCEPMCGTAQVTIVVLEPNNPPIAVDDNFTTTCSSPTGNLLLNDSDPDGDDIKVITDAVYTAQHGNATIYANGDFDYVPDMDYIGLDSFAYEIIDNGNPNLRDTATVYIKVEPDNDCDGIPDWDDIDDDNDGILDVDEGDGKIDSDLDGIPDSYDIDSDDDGIVDNIEGQAEHHYIEPTGFDTNHNGWDDAYDPEDGGIKFEPVDTDGDSTPDYLDLDSDGDHVYDFIEGHDINADGIPDVSRIFSDSDHDGLDDIYDTVFGWNDPDNPFNALGSNAPLQDFDHDGWRDWRDTNDEDDEFMTIDEDLNNDGDYSNDDLDLDGYPDYLDKTLDCEFFIPEGFSPNGDGVHDFFQILCIQRYPNAILMIFNRNGDKLFEKDHYGNLDYWGSNEDAWWWGTTQNKWTIGHTGGLNAGNYVYVLQLGNGEVKKGTVMISY